MGKQFVLVTLLLVFTGTTYSQFFNFNRPDPYQKVFVETDNFDDSYLQILEKALAEIEADTLKFSVLNDLAYYWHTRNLNKALDFTEEGLELTAKAGDTLWNGRFQITQGAVLLRQEKLDQAETVLLEAQNKVREHDLPHLFTQLGYVYERRGKLGKAADYALLSLELGKKLDDNKAMAMAYSDLSNLFWKQSKYDKGLEYGLLSLSFFEKWGITDLDYDFTLYIVGNNYLSLEEYDEAIAYYLQAIELGERYGFYNNLSDVYISLVDLYIFQNELQKAEEAGRNALKYAILLENAFMVMRSYLALGELYLRTANYEKAIDFFRQSITVATEDFGDGFFLSRAYAGLGKALAQTGKYREAYQAFDIYDSLRGKVFTAEADQRISRLQTEFDVAQKENTINLQEVRLKQQKATQELILVITGLLLLFVVFLVFSFRNNSKKNKLLEKQNKEKEFLLKEIHHRVKNNLEIVSSLLALQSSQNKDPNVVAAMKESQNRVYSMGIIHQRLYLGEHLASIEMKNYFENLGSHILDSYGKTDLITINYQMEPLRLEVDTAIPLGLIVNELFSNSLKYAFPDNIPGEISIQLKRHANKIVLVVKDNGIGLNLNEVAEGTGFGTKLIKLLTTQLNGSMRTEVDSGTKLCFEFKTEAIAADMLG